MQQVAGQKQFRFFPESFLSGRVVNHRRKDYHRVNKNLAGKQGSRNNSSK